MSELKLLVPDIGDEDSSAEVIEILFKEGDDLNKEDIVVVLESDKATMEIPSEAAGVLRKLLVKLGDDVKTGDALAIVESLDAPSEVAEPAITEEAAPKQSAEEKEQPTTEAEQTTPESSHEPRLEIEYLPDTGSEGGAELIEVSCKVGDQINKDDILFVLESDKATMEIPASFSGEVKQLFVKLGDQLETGAQLLEVLTSDSVEKTHEKSQAVELAESSATHASSQESSPRPVQQARLQDPSYRNPNVHAGPAARRLARELGVDLSLVKPSGPKERILKDDIKAFVKANLGKGAGSNANEMFSFELPEVDFSKFGEIEKQKLSRIKKVSAKNLSRSWLTIPHVTQFDEADITDLEDFRKNQKDALKQQGINLTPLAFLVKACANTLLAFPGFNASLDKSGDHLILKKYVHIGVAVDTEDGLVVPVIRDANKKSISEIAKELGEISEKARNKKLMPQDMQGACFSISSLGGIGGTAFTPIVNWPEVAILGVSRSQMKPVYDGEGFQPRLMLPLSLSYDHRVIDGAAAARFSRYLADELAKESLLSL